MILCKQKKESHFCNSLVFCVGVAGFEPATPCSQSRCASRTALCPDLQNHFTFNLSGYQDSNLGPPAPKAGALAGLRYAPIIAAEKGGFEPPVAFGTTTV